jgi:uncharacterized membrane protein YdjX (TVP38/TMEM64 family)
MAEVEPDSGTLSDIDDDVELDTVEPGLSRELKRMLGLLAGAAAIFALLYFTPVGAIVSDVQALRDFLKGDDLWAELAFAAIVTVLVAIGMPRLLFYGVGGLAFGFWFGLLLAQLGSVCGSALTFLAIRHGGRAWLEARFGQHRFFSKVLRVRSSVKAVVLIRQLPLHGMMITGGLALSQVSLRVFLLGTFIGFLPQGVLAALISSGMVDEQATAGLGKLVVAGTVLLIVAALLWRKKRRKPQ